MKVVHLQYASSPSGNYTITLHDLMSKNGIDSSVLALLTTFEPEDKKINWLGKIPALKSRLDSKIQDFLNKNNNELFGGFSYPIFGNDLSNHDAVKKADVIYVHWILNGFMNMDSLIQIAELGTPMVFVLHDMWTFTGGCHYSFDCFKFQTGCSNCQILPENTLIDRAKLLFKKKIKFFKRFDHLYFISPSRWMYENARNSLLLQFNRGFLIPNPPSDNFKVRLDDSYRRNNNISSEKKIIGFGANYISSPYKGFAYLLEALHHLKSNSDESDYEILIFGSALSPEILDKIPFPVHYTGYLNSENEISLVYNAMDVFIVSSIVDNLPTTVLESLSCGTPVVGFNTGGIPDMIDHKVNGYLAEYKNSLDLSYGITYCLDSSLKGYLKDEFVPSKIIQEHIRLINEIKKYQIL